MASASSAAAAAAAISPTFRFQLSQPKFPTTRLLIHHHKTHKPFSPFPKLHFITRSIDVSKEDRPTNPEQQQQVQGPELDSTENIDKRRLEEKFAVLNTGIHECRSCGYLYNEATGDTSYPIPPGLPFEKLPEDWRCPTCGAAQSFFENKSVEIAGFAQNQQYGLGGNTLTSGQKALLIYGSLLFFFVLFLSGYFLQ